MGERKKMPWFFSSRLSSGRNYSALVKKIVNTYSILSVLLAVTACGRVYFPVELKTIPRADRSEKQEESEVILMPMTSKNIKSANLTPYIRQIIEAGDLKEPAKLIPAEIAIVENYPINNDPGPYLIGIGDVIEYEEKVGGNGLRTAETSVSLTVNDNGFINFFQLGRLSAEGKTLSQVEDLMYKKVVETGGNTNFNLSISEFNSKQILISAGMKTKVIPYVSTPMFVDQIMEQIELTETVDARISIARGDNSLVFSYKNLIINPKKRVRLFPGDRVFVEPLNYRSEKVLLVGETGAQRSIKINSVQRPSLSDAIFSGTVLNSISSDFSQVYVLRKKRKLFFAYHLDITDPTRVSLANQFEMRPDDIIFVAAQPLSLYSRTLSQILGSTGLTLQARDTIRSELVN